MQWPLCVHSPHTSAPANREQSDLKNDFNSSIGLFDFSSVLCFNLFIIFFYSFSNDKNIDVVSRLACAMGSPRQRCFWYFQSAFNGSCELPHFVCVYVRVGMTIYVLIFNFQPIVCRPINDLIRVDKLENHHCAFSTCVLLVGFGLSKSRGFIINGGGTMT